MATMIPDLLPEQIATRVPDRRLLPLHKDPIEQARTAMFKLREQYCDIRGEEFPRKFRFALRFPETRNISGRTPY